MSSASLLKSEQTIKLPIMLTEHPTWQEALTDSILTRRSGDPARQEPELPASPCADSGREQGQGSHSQSRGRLPDRGLQIERACALRSPPAASGRSEGIDLLDPACKVEFVITGQALKERPGLLVCLCVLAGWRRRIARRTWSSCSGASRVILRRWRRRFRLDDGCVLSAPVNDFVATRAG